MTSAVTSHPNLQSPIASDEFTDKNIINEEETVVANGALIYFSTLGNISKIPQLNNTYIFSEPVLMYGSGTYSLQAVKEVKVTEGFKTLNEEQKNCQTVESLEQCLSTALLAKSKDECNCIPYELMNFSNANAKGCIVLDTCSQIIYGFLGQ